MPEIGRPLSTDTVCSKSARLSPGRARYDMGADPDAAFPGQAGPSA